MISFNLICTHDHEFEGWFQKSSDFERQAKKNLIECPVCGDARIEKSLMAPTIGAKGEVRARRIEKAEQSKQLRKMLGKFTTVSQKIARSMAMPLRKKQRIWPKRACRWADCLGPNRRTVDIAVGLITLLCGQPPYNLHRDYAVRRTMRQSAG
jgi:hypothetical protein